jgi:hypothetical protein
VSDFGRNNPKPKNMAPKARGQNTTAAFRYHSNNPMAKKITAKVRPNFLLDGLTMGISL